MLSRCRLLDPVRESLTPELEGLWKQGVYADFVEVIRTRSEAQKFHPLYLDMSQEAVLLYDRDRFLETLLAMVKEQLEREGAERKVMGNFWYWDLLRVIHSGGGRRAMNPGNSLDRMISQALIIIGEAEYLKEKEAWNMVVRRSQEAVELALKCALLWAKIEVPRIHDVGPILKQYAHRYPE
ncbi:MAG: HEPN domain-containing protein [Methanothrix sp.]